MFLFCSSSGMQLSGGKKRPYQLISSGVMDWRGDVAEGQQSSSAASADPQRPLCRPWDRGDFVRRLATFKSISWFAKPKVLSRCPYSIYLLLYLFSKSIIVLLLLYTAF